jgi:predicted negative regulator of RcsB-dependent stress response
MFARSFIKIILILFISFYYCTFVFAQADIKSKISSGLESLYNFNFKSSDKTFNSIIDKYPDHPAGYYYKSIGYLWFYLDSREESNLDRFIELTDSAIEKAELKFKTDSSDLFSLYIIGSVYGNRTFAYTREENYFDAVLAARKFHLYFDELLKRDSLYYDAYMGKGLFNFAISQAPQTWSWAINLAGMTGDKRKGLNYLETATKKGKYSKVEAKFYLSQIYSEFLLKYPQSRRLLNELILRYPKNLLFRFALANLQVKTFDLNTAIRNYKIIYTSKDTNFVQLKNYSGMALGDILYSKGEYDESRKYHRYFLEQSTDDHFKSVVALKLGLSHLLEGDSLSAILYFDKTNEGNMDVDDDAYAKIKGEQYLNHLPSSNELKLIRIKNMIDAGKLNAAIDSLEKFIELPVSDTLRAEAILSFSNALYLQGKYKRSLEYAVAVFNFDECELWVKPFACYYAARASKGLKNFVDAEFFIGYAGNFKNYFFENKLVDKLNYLSFILEEK